MNFLNSGKGFTLFEEETNKLFYVDKSLLIDVVYQYARGKNKYICITRPRRFGKSVAANMIAAFFDKSTREQSAVLFEGLEIGKWREDLLTDENPKTAFCWREQGRLAVIRINMISILTPDIRSFDDFYRELCDELREDIREAYPDISIGEKTPLSKALSLTGDRFVFIIDEWDAVFEMKFMTPDDKENYILFLKALLKDQSYVYFAYMTGILPIAKYTSGSPLNMFHEFSAFQDDDFCGYFGLTEEEIRAKIQEREISAPSLEQLRTWYDGYIQTADPVHIYNPASVTRALSSGVCRDYWTGTGPMNEVRDIIRHNVKDLREDVIRMAGGETLDIELSGFSVEKTEVNTKDEILSAMVVYGFLTYHEKQLRIPNHELMLKFRQALASEPLGLNQTLEESRKLVEATLARREEEVAGLLEDLHDEKIPFFVYNDENSLACVVTMGYISALDSYRITREDKAGKGYVDFLFEPLKKSDTAMVLELKYNHSAEDAIRCIREREYAKRLKDYDHILLVGINYSEAAKKHTCLIESVLRRVDASALSDAEMDAELEKGYVDMKVGRTKPARSAFADIRKDYGL